MNTAYAADRPRMITWYNETLSFQVNPGY